MTSTLEERLTAYRQVLEEAIEAELAVPQRGATPRRWRLLVPLTGAVAAASVLAYVMVGSERTMTSPAPAAPPPASAAASTPSVAPTATVDTSVTDRAIDPTATSATVQPPSGSPLAGISPGQVMAVGDSVMLGAADELTEAGVVVDAQVSRQMRDYLGVLERLRDRGQLPEALVVHLGNHGPISDDTLSSFFGVLVDVPHVIVLTDHAPRDHAAANNTKFAALPDRFPNVTVIAWDQLASDCPGVCLYDDGVHLRPQGQRYYAELVMTELQTPTVSPDRASALLPTIVTPASLDEELTSLATSDGSVRRLVANPDGRSTHPYCVIEELDGAEFGRVCAGPDGGSRGLLLAWRTDDDPTSPGIVAVTANTVTMTADTCVPTTQTTSTIRLSFCVPDPQTPITRLTFTNTTTGRAIRVEVAT